jgi:hypothetical protein
VLIATTNPFSSFNIRLAAVKIGCVEIDAEIRTSGFPSG